MNTEFCNQTMAFNCSDAKEYLAGRYHSDEPLVLTSVDTLSPEHFLRLFLTTHGMPAVGEWKSHTYVKYTDSFTGKRHFFLVPMPSRQWLSAKKSNKPRPNIRIIDDQVWIDHIGTSIYAQPIPYTNKDWYFHYNPNREHRPFLSTTLNLSPKCPERCAMCAGARTGRVNNGQEDTLAADLVVNDIATRFPESMTQLDILAVVTGCFSSFDVLYEHLKEVKLSVSKRFSPSQYRVLEHNVNTPKQFQMVVGELGYDVWITLECFDENTRYRALSGRVGRKGRAPGEFIDMIQTYADYLEAHPELGKKYVHVTYLIGLDSLETTEDLFKILSDMNNKLKRTKIIPWLSIFTPYNNGMMPLQRQDFGMSFLLQAQKMAVEYFGEQEMTAESGGTVDGYARGLF